MWSEAKHVASNLCLEVKLSRTRSQGEAKCKMDESPEEAYFRKSVFYIICNVIGGLTVHFNVTVNISEKFSFLWKYL